MKFFQTMDLNGLRNWSDVHGRLKELCRRSEREAGAAFELFCKAYYLCEPAVKDEYENVWLGNEAPLQVLRKLNLGLAEHGRDLILKDKEGRFSLVQCKFKSNQDVILSWSKDKIANLFAEGDVADFVIVFTNASGLDRYSRLKKAHKLKLVTVGDLLQVEPEILRSIIATAQGIPARESKIHAIPRSDQINAINDVIQGFTSSTRGQLILPCGTGKTLTSLWIKEALEPRRTLVLVPSLALLRQFKNEWMRNQKAWQPYLCVCSEKDIDKGGDAPEVHTYEIAGKVTTESKEIRAFLSKYSTSTIYCTYQSLDAIRRAMQGRKFAFDLVVCDEAHKTAGPHSHEFALIHRDANIPAHKRLYMTATPRIRSRRLNSQLDEPDLIADMSDPKVFGPVFHRMTFKTAIELGILVDYKILATGVNNSELHRAIKKRVFADHSGETVEDYAHNYALNKFMGKYPATHAITFHYTVKRAELFKERHLKIAPSIYSDHVSGLQTTNHRCLVMDAFKQAPKAVVTNARCLTEGIDVPAIDAVYFCDPKNSVIDIVQASGRALRKARYKNKELGYIVIPIYHRSEELLESDIQSGPYKKLVDVIRALSDEDERLQAEIDAIKLGLGGRNKSSATHGILDGDDTAMIVLEGFAPKLKKALFDQIIEKTFDHWNFAYELLKEFRRRHVDRWPPEEEVFKGYRLGQWCGACRQEYRRKCLKPERVKLLNQINFSWHLRNDRWQEFYESLLAYREKHPGKWPSRDEIFAGKELEPWCQRQRSDYKNGELYPQRIKLLNTIGFVWIKRESRWQKLFDLLREYKQRFHKWPSASVVYKGKQLGRWCTRIRSYKKDKTFRQDRIRLLDSIDFPWEQIEGQWRKWYELLKSWHQRFPKKWPRNIEIYKGKKLGSWCSNQRTAYKQKTLSPKHTLLLDKLGFPWDKNRDLWPKWYELLASYRHQFSSRWPGHHELYKGENLGNWCQKQRRDAKQKRLSQERVALLNLKNARKRPF